MAALIPLLITIVFAAGFLATSDRLRHPQRDVSAPKSVPTPAPAYDQLLAAGLRQGVIGSAGLSDPQRCTAVIAPMSNADVAVELRAWSGDLIAIVPAGEVTMSRAWAAGHLVAARGELRREYGSAWPANLVGDGWEIHLVTASGSVYRCSGQATGVTNDLNRLHERIHAAGLAVAS